MTERLVTAYHEAGHCVAAISDGGRVRRVYLTSESEGMAHNLVSVSLSEMTAARHGMFVSLAGPVAENVYVGANDLTTVPRSADLAHALDHAAVMGFGDVDDLIDETLARLTRLFRQRLPWARVAAIAERLAIAGELEEQEVTNLYWAAEPRRLCRP